MRLLELASVAPIEAVRDGELRSLGLLSHARPAEIGSGCRIDTGAVVVETEIGGSTGVRAQTVTGNLALGRRRFVRIRRDRLRAGGEALR